MIGMTTPVTRVLTFEEWLKLPETKKRYEIVDGVMLVPPGPNVDHQWIQQEIFANCREFARSSQQGLFLHAPLDLVVQRDPLRVRQPDIMFLNSERTGIRNRSDLVGLPFIEAAPDIVVEVLPPCNTRREMEGRLSDYQQIGVYECWLISPEAETAEIIDLSQPELRSLAVFSSGEALVSSRLPGFELKLAEIFS